MYGLAVMLFVPRRPWRKNIDEIDWLISLYNFLEKNRKPGPRVR